ncbi:methyl-accepting chemotaxis protein [Modicisalibacter muralis]|uniref:methyl-accepting chemotaxis protein n=1 Tax=Modicisalibacter muralis TaxID=119000 RepID=UPI00158785F3|nr:methyl-accepting chemotaxis protein [Halomonas muralis]
MAPIYLKANRLMAAILVLLFLATLALASIHDRWASALLVGSAAMLIPLAAMRVQPTALITRLLVATSLMVFSALQIHLLSGMIEAHFSVFILLSVLLAYRDWRTIVCAATVIAVHHALFCYLQHLGFGVYVMPEMHPMSSYVSMVVIHAVYVVVQSIALCILARQMARDAVTGEELGRLSSHIGRRQGVFDLGFDDTAMSSELGAHFKRTMLAVRGTLTSVSSSIAHVLRISEDIVKGDEDLSSRNQRQEVVLSDTINALESLSRTVHDNSTHAREANELAATAGQVAEQGRKLVDELSAAMSRMRESSAKISDITSMIDSIAFQTNILALNAAVEAARAGQSGRGFAVVAAEVRELAQKSASASQDIRALVDTSQRQVADGASKANDVERNMGDILDQTQRVALIMSDISAASREQSEGVNEVSAAINSIGDATRDNGVLVGDMAGAAESLRRQADILSQAVRVFALEASGSAMATPAEHDVSEPGSAAAGPAGWLQRQADDNASLA